MKKTIMAGAIVLGTLSLASCERTEKATASEGETNKVVVDRDSVATEYEVTETVVEYDTTKRTKVVDAETAKKGGDNLEVKKDKD